jgi:hypothetical protein
MVRCVGEQQQPPPPESNNRLMYLGGEREGAARVEKVAAGLERQAAGGASGQCWRILGAQR